MSGVGRAVRWALFLAWAAAVWNLSARSDPKSDLSFPWEIPDKVAHAAEYAVGGFLARAAFASVGARRAWSAAVVACALWGMVDEIHQGFVPGRATDPFDLVADVTGAALGAAVHAELRRRGAPATGRPGAADPQRPA